MPKDPDVNTYRQLVYKDYLAGTKKILEDSQHEYWPYEVDVLGKKFTVHKNVFSPKYFNDTAFFAEHLPIVSGDDVLEIGCGTGVVSIFAIYKGAHTVVAVDLNPDAVRNTIENARLHGMERRIDVREGDVYEALGSDEKFDVVFWNTPFGLINEQNISMLRRSVDDPGYAATRRFITQAPQYLRKNGRVLIGFSSTLGRLDLIQQFVREAGMSLSLVKEIASTEVHPVKFEIFEAKYR